MLRRPRFGRESGRVRPTCVQAFQRAHPALEPGNPPSMGWAGGKTLPRQGPPASQAQWPDVGTSYRVLSQIYLPAGRLAKTAYKHRGAGGRSRPSQRRHVSAVWFAGFLARGQPLGGCGDSALACQGSTLTPEQASPRTKLVDAFPGWSPSIRKSCALTPVGNKAFALNPGCGVPSGGLLCPRAG